MLISPQGYTKLKANLACILTSDGFQWRRDITQTTSVFVVVAIIIIVANASLSTITNTNILDYPQFSWDAQSLQLYLLFLALRLAALQKRLFFFKKKKSTVRKGGGREALGVLGGNWTIILIKPWAKPSPTTESRTFYSLFCWFKVFVMKQTIKLSQLSSVS